MQSFRTGVLQALAWLILGISADVPASLAQSITDPASNATAPTSAQDRQAVLTGPLTMGALVLGQAPPGTIAVDLDGTALALSVTGQFAFGLPREAAEVGVLTLKHGDGTQTQQFLYVEGRRFGRQDVVGLPPATVTLPPELAARRLDERARIDAARKTTNGRQTGVYGTERTRNGQLGNPHWGIDIANVVGTPIVAPADGIVTLAEPDLLLEGGVIILDHGNGVFTDYQHLSALAVRAGDLVAQGQHIGSMGNTGRSSGPHLHWGLAWRANPQAPLIRLDPALLAGLGPLKTE
jgi:murein DD-endopeptidase MepM/ murein hydrolase activator NlpD